MMKAGLNSISARFTSAAVGTAVVTLVCLIAVVILQMDQSNRRQEREMELLSEIRLDKILKADARLAATRLKFLIRDTERRVTAIASRTDTIAAAASRNIVAIYGMLEPTAASADVDAIVVVDHNGKAVGASSPAADLIALTHRIAELPFAGRIQDLLTHNRRDRPKTFSALKPLSETGRFLEGGRSNRISQIIFVPLFDDFGDIAGGLLAQRFIREEEQLLAELAKIGSVGLAVVHDEAVISRAGFDGDAASLVDGGRHAEVAANPTQAFHCAALIIPLEICALKPVKELYEIQNELTRIGKQEQSFLLSALIVLGIVAIILFAFVSIFLSRHITYPLTRITNVLARISEGQYEDAVDGTQRSDEVGNIARSVVSLQASLKERDSLRSKLHASNKILRQQEGELRTQNSLFDAALNNMSHGLCMFDVDERLIVSNQRYLELFDLSADQVVPGMTEIDLAGLIEFSEVDTAAPSDDASDVWQMRPGEIRSSSMVKLRDGRTILITRQPLQGGGWVAISEDVTERELDRDHLAYLANHDALTDLPNRISFRSKLDAAIEKRRRKGGKFAIFCLDLDEFKTVNDSLGHPVGDELLRRVADRLRLLMSDRQIVARLGGDEFAILTHEPAEGAALEEFARLIIEEISRPYHIAEHETVIGVSIGIAVGGDDIADGDELFKQADLALYKAKADGRNTFRFFEENMGTIVNARRELITDLRKAVERGELELYFQPQFDIEGMTIVGFEALLRWHHPKRGMISPAEFIPIAEDTGLIVALGEWILREACSVAVTWPETIRIAVNLSPRQLKTPGFGSVLLNALARTGLDPKRLELEVTEGVLLDDNKETLAILHQAQMLGVKVSMDDFGTGYSSLSYLRSFPFDKIKIDQSFVRSMAHSDDAVSIVEAVIDLSKSLKMTTTAEGVETKELLDRLCTIGCTEAQGYYLGRPMPAGQAAELLEELMPAAQAAELLDELMPAPRRAINQ